MKLTQAQIEGIRKRTEDATPGPWDVKTTEFLTLEDYKIEGVTLSVFEKEDAEFIANARQDIPALLAHIAELYKIIDNTLFDLTNENTEDPYVVNQIHSELAKAVSEIAEI